MSAPPDGGAAAAAARAIGDLPTWFNPASDLIDPHRCAGRVNLIAFHDRSGATSYRALADRVDRAAGILGALGLRRGQRVLLCVKGPTAAVGYWCNPTKSRDTFAGEWTRTGDSYARDADGWYSYGGRRDDLMKVGGIYVSPIKVEEALLRHADVVEAAVVGTADRDGLVKPCAYVVLRPGCPADAACLKAQVKAVLAPYKSPRWFRFVDVLPKTATGKVQRYRLREPEWA